MGILFLVLKIIGFILLGLLAFLILLLLAVLFVPIRYRVVAQYEEKAIARITAGWFLHLIGVRLMISDQEKSCKLKLFGIPLIDFFSPHKDRRKKRRSKSHQDKQPAKQSVHRNKQPAEQSVHQDEQPVEQLVQQDEQNNLQINEEQQQIGSEKEKASGFDTDQTSDEKASFFTKVRIYINRISDKIKKIRKKETNLKEQYNKWLVVLKRDRTKEALEKCKNTLCKVLKAVLPRKWKLFVHYGMEDPALTADILGYYWMLFAVLSGHIDCQPDFENKVFECNLHAKGYIRMITMVIAGWKFLFDPDLIYLRKIKKEVDSL
mgnify:CR=1 FL=1